MRGRLERSNLAMLTSSPAYLTDDRVPARERVAKLSSSPVAADTNSPGLERSAPSPGGRSAEGHGRLTAEWCAAILRPTDHRTTSG